MRMSADVGSAEKLRTVVCYTFALVCLLHLFLSFDVYHLFLSLIVLLFIISFSSFLFVSLTNSLLFFHLFIFCLTCVSSGIEIPLDLQCKIFLYKIL